MKLKHYITLFFISLTGLGMAQFYVGEHTILTLKTEADSLSIHSNVILNGHTMGKGTIALVGKTQQLTNTTASKITIPNLYIKHADYVHVDDELHILNHLTIHKGTLKLTQPFYIPNNNAIVLMTPNAGLSIATFTRVCEATLSVPFPDQQGLTITDAQAMAWLKPYNTENLVQIQTCKGIHKYLTDLYVNPYRSKYTPPPI